MNEKWLLGRLIKMETNADDDFLSRELLNSVLSSAVDWIFQWKPRDLNISSKHEPLNFSSNSVQKRKVINNRRRSLVKNTKEKEDETQRWWKIQPLKSKGETRTWKARQKVVAEKETRREEFWKATLIVSARCPHPALQLSRITKDYQGLSRIITKDRQGSSRIVKDHQGLWARVVPTLPCIELSKMKAGKGHLELTSDRRYHFELEKKKILSWHEDTVAVDNRQFDN